MGKSDEAVSALSHCCRVDQSRPFNADASMIVGNMAARPFSPSVALKSVGDAFSVTHVAFLNPL